MWIFLAFIMLMLTSIFHCIWMRVSHHTSQVFCFLLIGFPIGMIHIVLSFYFLKQTDEILASILVYAVCCQFLLYLFSLTANGVSVSVLEQLSKGSIHLDFFSSDYSTDLMVTNRINQLQLDGFLIKNNEECQLTSKGRILVKSFLRLRIFFGHESLIKSKDF